MLYIKSTYFHGSTNKHKEQLGSLVVRRPEAAHVS